MSLVNDKMQEISQQIISCPLCNARTQLEVYKKGFLSRSYSIRCPVCEAEWVYNRKSTLPKSATSKHRAITNPFKVGFEWGKSTGKGKSYEESFPKDDIVNDDSIWVLKKPDRNQSGAQFLEKKIDFYTWKQMTYTLDTVCANCGAPLATNTEVCQQCGVKTI
jgi:hypothetical protein